MRTNRSGKTQEAIRSDAAESRLARRAVPLTVLICLFPLILLWDEFQALYWFHDDWELVSEMESLPFSGWLALRYGENFSPVFKGVWEAAVLLAHGRYLGMILLLWIIHIANLLLFAALMKRCGFPWRAQVLAVLTLGLAWSNIESLAWASCLVSLLPTLFLLLAWVLLLRAEASAWSSLFTLAAIVCALASAMSFSRGVFTGAVLAFFTSATALHEGRLTRRDVWVSAGFVLVTVGSLIPYRWMFTEYGNFSALNGLALSDMLSYAAHYFLLSPLYQLIPVSHASASARELVLVGTAKIVIVVSALLLSKGRQRSLLWALLLLDVIAAGLLGAGRYKLPIATSFSYRYQYLSLLCFAPFLALCAEQALQRLKESRVREAAFAMMFFGWGAWIGIPWARYMAPWSQARGADVRTALSKTAPGEQFGLASITAGRAKELIRIYNLH